MKNRVFPSMRGGAESNPNLVATEAEAQSMAKSRPIMIFFTLKGKTRKHYISPVNLNKFF